MKWYGISGSWRKTNSQVENDVRRVVKEIIEKGNGIVTGGALNVDFFATDEALKVDPSAKHIKVLLPTTLQKYATHYRKRAGEGVITVEQAEKLIEQLTKLQSINVNSVIENRGTDSVEQVAYYERNSQVVNNSNELFAFQVNQSAGTQNTIEKAKKKNVPVHIFTYTIE